MEEVSSLRPTAPLNPAIPVQHNTYMCMPEDNVDASGGCRSTLTVVDAPDVYGRRSGGVSRGLVADCLWGAISGQRHRSAEVGESA